MLCLIIFLIAVLHRDAQHSSVSHRSRSLLQHQPVLHGFVHLAVQSRVQNALQPEITVLFLQMQRNQFRSEAILSRTIDGF